MSNHSAIAQLKINDASRKHYKNFLPLSGIKNHTPLYPWLLFYFFMQSRACEAREIINQASKLSDVDHAQVTDD